MKIDSISAFVDALKLLALDRLDVTFKQSEEAVSALGVPMQVLQSEEAFERFKHVIRERYKANEMWVTAIDSNVLVIVYKAEHHPKIFPQIFKALEDFQWGQKNAAR